jgi:hypothetical protein
MQSQPESLNTSLNHIHSAAQTRFTQPLPSPASQNYVPFLIKSNRFHHPKTHPAIPPIGTPAPIQAATTCPPASTARSRPSRTGSAIFCWKP